MTSLITSIFYQENNDLLKINTFLDEIDERVHNINEHFTFSLYSNVCRSLFEKNKLHFAFLLSIRIMMDAGQIDPDEWRHFLAGGTPSEVSILF